MSGQSLVSLFRSGACANVSKTAVVYDDGLNSMTATYEQLLHWSKNLSVILRQSRVSKECIGVVLKSSIFMLPVLIGVMDVPCSFCPLSEDMPKKYFNNILSRLNIRVLIVTTSLLKKMTDHLAPSHRSQVIQELDVTVITTEGAAVVSEGLAYCITTSGTTGQPKVVKVPHACIVPNITDISSRYKLSSSDTVVQISPLTFDPSIVEIFSSLYCGARLLLVPELVKKMPRLLMSLLLKHRVTVLQGTPTLVSSLDLGILLSKESPLRVLSYGGESFPSLDTLRQHRHPDNVTEVFNLYGITEVSCWASCYKLSFADDDNCITKVPLGDALADTLLEVRDCEGKLVDSGTGCLFIGGEKRQCLIDDEEAPAAMRSSGDTVEVRDGSLWYLGREDDQVKRHGKRINLLQLNEVCMQTEGVKNCVSMVKAERLYLVIQLVQGASFSLVEDRILTVISENLPPYYKPDYLLPYAGIFPFTKHGKIDKEKLFAEVTSHKSAVHVCTVDNVENRLRTEWKLLLGGDVAVEKDSRFLALGGDSFTALRLQDVMQAACGTPLQAFLDLLLTATFADVVRYVKHKLHSLDSEPPPAKLAKMDTVSTKSPRLSAITESSDLKDNVTATCEVCFRQQSCAVMSIQRTGRIYLYDTDLDIQRHISPVRQKAQPSNPDIAVTMSLLWKNHLRKCIDASPLLVADKNGASVYIGCHSHIFRAIDVSSGATLWETCLGDRIESSAALSKCTRFVVVGCYDGMLYVLERSSGTVVWTFSTGGQVKCSPVVDPVSGLVCVGCHGHSVVGLNILAKQSVWQQREVGGSIFSSPCISQHPHHLCVASLAGKLLSLQPTTGDVIWSVELSKPVFSSPAVDEVGVYVGCVDGGLYCFSHHGVMMWQYTTTGPIFSSPAIVPCINAVFFGSHDGSLYCVSRTNDLLWKSAADSAVFSSPFVFQLCDKHDSGERRPLVACCSTKGTLTIHDLTSGETLSSLALSGEVFSSPVVLSDKIIIGCRNNNLYCISVFKNNTDTVIHV